MITDEENKKVFKAIEAHDHEYLEFAVAVSKLKSEYKEYIREHTKSVAGAHNLHNCLSFIESLTANEEYLKKKEKEEKDN